jgi:polyisoprenoid-binding protein YceI
MAVWIFEPGHTEIVFRARHMMVTWVRGAFKNVQGEVDFDRESPLAARFKGEVDAAGLWTGVQMRDDHLRSPAFFDVETHPKITFAGRLVERSGDTHFKAVADVSIRGTTLPVEFDVAYLGQWDAPFWVGDENRGTMRRIGFEGRTRVNRQDFGVSWQDELPGGGRVAGDEIDVILDVEAIHEGDLEKTGAIEHYRS